MPLALHFWVLWSMMRCNSGVFSQLLCAFGKIHYPEHRAWGENPDYRNSKLGLILVKSEGMSALELLTALQG
jgi:hypothetical protein